MALEPAVKREGWKIILLSQLHPLFPTSLLNYLYGLTQIRFRTCMLWVAIGQAPGLFLYSYLGTLGQYGLNLARGKTHPRLIEYLVWLGGFILAALVLVLLGRIALRLLQETEGTASSRRGEAEELPLICSSQHHVAQSLVTDAGEIMPKRDDKFALPRTDV